MSVCSVCVCVVWEQEQTGYKMCHILVVGPYEEVIGADGIVEEYFAFDATSVKHNNYVIANRVTMYYRGDELMGSSHGKGRRANKRRGLPPITPNACVKDTVGSQVFDLVWAEVSMCVIVKYQVYINLSNLKDHYVLFFPPQMV